MAQKNKIKKQKNLLKYCNSPEVTKVSDYRNDWVIVDSETGEIVDNGDGWGYTTKEKAINHWRWQYGKYFVKGSNEKSDFDKYIEKKSNVNFLSHDELEKEYYHISDRIGKFDDFIKSIALIDSKGDVRSQSDDSLEYVNLGEINALECSMIAYQSMLSAILTLQDSKLRKRKGDIA